MLFGSDLCLLDRQLLPSLIVGDEAMLFPGLLCSNEHPEKGEPAVCVRLCSTLGRLCPAEQRSAALLAAREIARLGSFTLI